MVGSLKKLARLRLIVERVVEPSVGFSVFFLVGSPSKASKEYSTTRASSRSSSSASRACERACSLLALALVGSSGVFHLRRPAGGKIFSAIQGAIQGAILGAILLGAS